VQPSVVKLNDHQYVAFFRSRFADFIYKSTSSDGCTWTPPVATKLPNNNSSIQAVLLKNGHIAIAFNNVGLVMQKGKPKAGPRKPLSVAISEDGGNTWPWVRDVETGRPGVGESEGLPDAPGREEYSYPAILQTGSGSIIVAYTWRRETMKVVEISEFWVHDGSTQGQFKGDKK
jgi:predicted neuraminidase